MMKEKFIEIFKTAGIEVNGSKPWDIQVKNEKFYARVLSGGSLALGESYMNGWWECQAIDELITRITKNHLRDHVHFIDKLKFGFYILKDKFFNLQSKQRSRKVGEMHYDVGNELYKLMLDKHMNYTCGYWADSDNLDDAQDAKLDLICRKLKLKKGMKILEIGCGWANLAKFMAKNYEVSVVGCTISKEQLKEGKKRCEGLDVEIFLKDYREMTGEYDCITSVGMFEHIGNKNYQDYFDLIDRCLKPDGISLLHTIGSNQDVKISCDPWLNKYIFPNSELPQPNQIVKSLRGTFKIEDWHNFGLDYDKTLMAWYDNFNQNWDEIRKMNPNYNERFKRMWDYYLSLCAGSFRSGGNALWQIVFTRIHNQTEYRSIR